MLRVALRWPATALLGWIAAWAAWAALRFCGVAPAWSGVVAVFVSLLAASLMRSPWRRLITAAGFPLSMVLLFLPGSAFPAWGWLFLLMGLAGLYPVRAWRDAPWYPTRRGALHGLALLAPFRGARVQPRILDAGCGHGAGLIELLKEYPQAELVGIEWSVSLCLLSRWRCRWARVRRADMWSESWTGYDMVYIFQRPETLGRALAKASREMRPGSWLVSLEFGAEGVAPTSVLSGAARQPVWLYRLPAVA